MLQWCLTQRIYDKPRQPDFIKSKSDFKAEQYKLDVYTLSIYLTCKIPFYYKQPPTIKQFTIFALY